MNPRFAKYSDEQLEQQLVRAEKNKKLVDVLFIVIVVLSVLIVILQGSIAAALSPLALAIVSKFVLIPMAVGNIKTEINERMNAKNIGDDK